MYVLMVFLIALIFLFTFTIKTKENYQNFDYIYNTMFCNLGQCFDEFEINDWRY